MPKRSCPTCNHRLPFAARRCLHCGWRHGSGGDLESARRRWRRRRVIWAVVVLVAVLGSGGLAYRNATFLADWYYTFAAQHLATPFSSYGPTDTVAGAYFYCARRVARQMDGEFSVETFPSLAESTAVELGGRRYQIQASVEEARESGERVRYAFACRVRYDRGRWVLEELRMRDYAGAPDWAGTRAGGDE